MAIADELSHLQPAYQPYARMSAEERLTWIAQDRWINYARADQILMRLSELLAYPPRDRMPCLLLFGGTGMGKTHILQKFLRDHRSSFDEATGRTRLPIAYVQMPPEPHQKDFYEELLINLGTVVHSDLRVTALRHRTRTLARQLEVRMLAIDEIHSMLAGPFREQRVFLNAIRFLANDLRIPLVCLGTHEAKQALMTDQQLADRFEAFELSAWVDDATFAKLLASFATILPLRKPSALTDAKMRKRILSLTDGVMVRICRLIEAAATFAIKTGLEYIDAGALTDELATSTLVSISDRRSRRVAG